MKARTAFWIIGGTLLACALLYGLAIVWTFIACQYFDGLGSMCP